MNGSQKVFKAVPIIILLCIIGWNLYVFLIELCIFELIRDLNKISLGGICALIFSV